MLSKTAMALVPAASLTGAAALTPTTSFGTVGREPRFRRRIRIARKTLGTESVEETLPPIAPKSVTKIGE